MTERWTDETLDRFASMVATSIATSNERLARIEQLAESNTQAIGASNERIDRFISGADERMEELEAASQALSRDVAQLVSTQEQNSRELNQAMIRLADTQQGIARLLANLDEDRPTILRKLNTIEGKVDSLIQRQN